MARAKEAYIARLATEPREAPLVSGADKVHNTRSILIDLREHGAGFFDVFRGGRDGTRWYYRTLVTTTARSTASSHG